MAYSFADVVLVLFPFTDQSGAKKRPAVIVSSSSYNTSRRDLIIMAITSQVRQPLGFGEALVPGWQAAGLIKPSVLNQSSRPSSRGSSSAPWARFRPPICARCEKPSPGSSAESAATTNLRFNSYPLKASGRDRQNFSVARKEWSLRPQRRPTPCRATPLRPGAGRGATRNPHRDTLNGL